MTADDAQGGAAEEHGSPDQPGHPCCRAIGRHVIGIDEVGRGALIGPVVAAAVRFVEDRPPGIRDSKRLSEKKRIALDQAIRSSAIVTLGQADVNEIDALGIHAATDLAMERAGMAMLDAIAGNPEFTVEPVFLVDGHRTPNLPGRIVPLVGGDDLCPTIGAASIIAKVWRDAWVTGIAATDTRYDWARNKGYGVPRHLDGIARHGVSEHHRRSFRPVHQAIRRIAVEQERQNQAIRRQEARRRP